MIKTIAFIVLSQLFASSALSNERLAAPVQYASAMWTEKDGLPSNVVLAMVQDRDGYLWLGTKAGLARFDGIRFVSWNIDRVSAIPGNYITALFTARDGSLWMGSSTGTVSRLHDGSITTYDSKQGLADGYVMALFEDRDGTMWAGGFGGLFHLVGGQWLAIRQQEGIPAGAILALHEDRGGTLWVGTSVGAFARRSRTSVFESYGSSSERVQGLAEDKSGTLWTTDSRRAFRKFSPSLAPGHSPGPARGLGSLVMIDAQNNLWVGTRTNGLFRVPGEAVIKTDVVEHFGLGKGLPSDIVQCLLQDREGNIWVGTGAGLARLSPVMGISVEASSVTANAVTSDAKGNVWVGTSTGLLRFTNGGQQLFTERDGLLDNDITALHSEPPGRLWIATARGLTKYEHGRFSRVSLGEGASPNRVVAITTDPEGGVWLCDYNRTLFRLANGRLAPIRIDRDLPSRLGVSAYTDKGGRVWIGFADGGVAVYDHRQIRSFNADDGLAPGRVNAIYQDRSGVVWIGTATGLTRFKDGVFTSILMTDRAFPLKSLTAIVDDDQGYLWLGGTSGVVRIAVGEFDLARASPSYRLQYRLFDAADGLPAEPVWRGYPTVARAGDGGLWFETANGISRIDPRRLPDSRRAPPIRIEQIAADNREFPVRASVQLPGGTSRIQIQYTALALTAPTKIRFRYKMVGFDPSWIEAGSARQASYANLSPGQYRFHVGAITSEQASDEAVLDFSIAPAFYQTFWFFGGCGTVGALSLWGIWQVRVRRIRHQCAMVLAERARVAREIHDTLLGNLVGITLQFDVIAQTLSSPALRSLREQLQQHIREARRSIWDLRSTAATTRDFTDSLGEKANTLVIGSGARIKCVVSGRKRCAPGLDGELLLIGQEAISNAARHGHANTIQVLVIYDEHHVTLRIKDDGQGFELDQPRSESSNHWGLRTMRERAQRIGASFTVQSSPGAGTMVEAIARLPPRP